MVHPERVVQAVAAVSLKATSPLLQVKHSRLSSPAAEREDPAVGHQVLAAAGVVPHNSCDQPLTLWTVVAVAEVVVVITRQPQRVAPVGQAVVTLVALVALQVHPQAAAVAHKVPAAQAAQVVITVQQVLPSKAAAVRRIPVQVMVLPAAQAAAVMLVTKTPAASLVVAAAVVANSVVVAVARQQRVMPAAAVVVVDQLI
ncbi:MAG: hypothetical protein MJA29_00145 [Candidatus Omnitrophica bacterium]|nr:hypothetical protein [Candidatus Omnitrophota bacterium]